MFGVSLLLGEFWMRYGKDGFWMALDEMLMMRMNGIGGMGIMVTYMHGIPRV